MKSETMTTTKRTEAERAAESAAYRADRAKAEELQSHGGIEASTAIRGKHAASGNKKLTTMQNSRKADTITEATADTMTKAGELRAKAAELRQTAKAERARANQSGRTPAEVRNGRAEAKRLDKAADKLTKAAKAMEDSTAARTFSDFQPIKHAAIVGRMTAEATAYVVTPNDMDRAAAKFAEAVREYEPGTPWEALNAAEAAAVIFGVEVDEDGHTITEPTRALFDMAYSNAIFRAATNAANREISSNLHHDSHTRTTEQKTLATPETIEAWRQTHGNNSGKGYKVYLDRDNANWITLEYRQYKTEPSGWYLVRHHKTVAPTVSLDAYAENSHRAEAEAAEHGLEALKAARAEAGEITPDIVTNGGIPSVETQEARERIEAIIETMNPTAREADFLRYFLSPKAAHAGQEAVNAAEAVKVNARRAEAEAKAAKRTAAVKQTKEAKAAAKAAEAKAKEARAEADKIQALTENGEMLKGVELIRYRAMRHAAAAHVGIQTTTAETTFMSRLKAKVTEAAKVEQGCTTPEEAAEAEAKHWERMQKNRQRGHRAAEAVQVLFVGIDTPEAIARAAAQLDKAAKGKHATKADKARADRAREATKATEATAANVIAWQTPGEAWKAAEEHAARGEATRKSRTAYAAHNAAAAALVFLANVTAREAEAIAARLKAEATNPGTDYRAAEVEARAAEQAAHAARHTAKAADLARVRAEARKAAEAHAAAWNARPGEPITAAAWNAMEAATRLTFLDTIHAAGKRLEFVTA